jgi:hypothetical protein
MKIKKAKKADEPRIAQAKRSGRKRLWTGMARTHP